MTKRDAEILGRVFDVELTGRLPAQIKGKRIVTLCELGYVDPMARTLDGAMPVTVRGWVLTERGRMDYCAWAAAQPATKEEA